MSTLATNAITTVAGKPILNSTGSIIQVVYVRSDAITTFASAASGDGTTITPLGLSITPTSANSRIICNWMINGEIHHDDVFLVHRDGSLITTAGEEGRNSVSNNQWVGFAPATYDTDQNSTLQNITMQYSQIAGSTTSRTYAPAVRASGATAQTFYFNRSQGSTGTSTYENTVSTGVLYEVVG